MNDTTRFTSSPWRHPSADSPNSSFNITCFWLFLGGRSCYSTVARGNGELYIRSSPLVLLVVQQRISWYPDMWRSSRDSLPCTVKVINYHVNWIKGGVPGREGANYKEKWVPSDAPHAGYTLSKKVDRISLLRVFHPLRIRSQSMKVKESGQTVECESTRLGRTFWYNLQCVHYLSRKSV